MARMAGSFQRIYAYMDGMLYHRVSARLGYERILLTCYER